MTRKLRRIIAGLNAFCTSDNKKMPALRHLAAEWQNKPSAAYDDDE